jgi:hypothetical protein
MPETEAAADYKPEIDRVSCIFFGFDPRHHGNQPVWSSRPPELICPGTVMHCEAEPITRPMPVVAWIVLCNHRVTVEYEGRIWPNSSVGIIQNVLAGQRIHLKIRIRRNLEK